MRLILFVASLAVIALPSVVAVNAQDAQRDVVGERIRRYNAARLRRQIVIGPRPSSSVPDGQEPSSSVPVDEPSSSASSTLPSSTQPSSTTAATSSSARPTSTAPSAPLTTMTPVRSTNSVGSVVTVIAIFTQTPTITTTSASASASGNGNDGGLGGKSIAGLVVVASLAVLGIGGFIYWKMTRKRFAGFEDTDAEAIKWPELQDAAQMQPLPTRTAPKSDYNDSNASNGPDYDSQGASMRPYHDNQSLSSAVDLSRGPVEQANYYDRPNSVVHDPAYGVGGVPDAGGYYDPYSGPVPAVFSPQPHVTTTPGMGGRTSPGPNQAYGGASYGGRAVSPGPQAAYGGGRSTSPGPQVAYGGDRGRPPSMGPNLAYGGQRSGSPGPNVAYGGPRSTSPGPNVAYGGPRSTSPGPNMAYGGQRSTSPGPNVAYGGGRSTSPGPNAAYGGGYGQRAGSPGPNTAYRS